VARALFLLVVFAAASGCATRHPGGLTARFVKPGEPTVDMGGPAPATAPKADLQEFARKVRELQARATPRVPNLLPTIESRNPALAEALLRLSLMPSAEHHRLVAEAYRDAGVADHALRHYQRALRLEACDSASYEGLAQIWRNWGFAGLALSDAHRAVYCAPASASAQNTLGTVLEALGQRQAARAAFERAVTLAPDAVYALNNLCFLAVRDGNGTEAQRACERALAIQPGMKAAHTNLALAFAIQGDLVRAEQQLLDSADAGEAYYNVGMLRMSTGRYAEAAEAFDRAKREGRRVGEAHRRAMQARAMAAAQR
jgi:tetratricopeptide (TPR) repeat protein